MPTLRNAEPYSGYNFLITINGVSDDGQAVSGSFSEVAGLELEVTAVEYPNGSGMTTDRKMPGLAKHTNITCNRGINSDVEFWNWILTGV